MSESATQQISELVNSEQLPIPHPTSHIPHASRSLVHLPFLLILLLHLALSLTYARTIPLGEAPDEPAHLAYAGFIAQHGRLPTTLAERREAGYRSAWPPLYHFLIAAPLAAIGNAPPTRLKAVGDNPRRLIPTNGQTIAAFIHTADEAPPWHGLPLAWHLGRYISIALTTLAVTLTYTIVWRLTGQYTLAASAAALHAFIPQVLFIGSVINDDNLLICLSGLIFLALITYPPHPSPRYAFLLGALLGLATVAKYNALPLWVLAAIWVFWPKKQTRNNQPLSSILPFLLGALLTAGWWFIFIWLHFNQVDSLGLLSGSLAALTAGTSDASFRQLTTVIPLSFPAAAAWPEWFTTLFETFWGSFGGGSTIDLPTWAYWLLVLICLVAIISGVRGQRSGVTHHAPRTRAKGHLWAHRAPHFTLHASRLTPHASHLTLFLLSLLFFLPLPLLRFILTGSIIETAQGRHLFPALPAITLGLVWGVSRVNFNTSRITHHASRIILPLFAFLFSLYSLHLISTSYPPPIPLRTTADAATAANFLKVKVAESITLIGYEVGQSSPGLLPVTLIWQANAVPPDDYLIELTLTGAAGQPLGGWLGHPLGGRYPTRAWDEGDILRHTIPIPLLPNLPTPTTLTLRLLDSSNQPTSAPLTLTSNLPTLQPSNLPILLPSLLRADELPSDAPFTYRSTLSFVLADSDPTQLIASTGQTFTPTHIISGPGGSIAHFIVAAHWPSGNYIFKSKIGNLKYPLGTLSKIENRPRQFNLPPIQHTLNANFADTLTLLGYDLPQRRVQPGATFPITLHWRAERTIGQHLIAFNHLLDQAAIQRGGADRIPQLYYTTLLWVPGEVVSDAYDVPIAADAPAGVYWLDVGLYPSEQPTFSLPLFENGQPLDHNSVRLGPLKIGGPPPGVTIPQADPQNPLNLSFANQITLLGFDLSGVHNNPKSTPERAVQNLKLYWRADAPSPADYTVFVHLLDPAGKLVAQFDSPPASGAYPTSLWDSGEIIADEHTLKDLPSGHYILQIGLYRPDTGERLPVAGSPDGVVKLTEFEMGE